MTLPKSAAALPPRMTSSRISGLGRSLVVLASALLGTLFFLPLWIITLDAPQYPEGISLIIKLRTISGGREFDLSNLNMLNHYIGMQRIVPDSIPELRYMQWIVAALVVAGFLVAILGKRKLLVTWVAAFALLGVAGMVDFYKWGYDYGHNLDSATAIIKVPGMSYQPPLIGSKQLLNFTAHSWPASGSMAAGLAFVIALGALFLAYRNRTTRNAVAATALLAAACGQSSGPPTMNFTGRDSCKYCLMAITDSHVGGAFVNGKGKTYRFDSIECLASYVLANEKIAAEGSLWVLDFASPGKLIPAANAKFFQRAVGLNSAMGGNLVATSRTALALPRVEPNSELNWKQVLQLVAHRVQRPASAAFAGRS